VHDTCNRHEFNPVFKAVNVRLEAATTLEVALQAKIGDGVLAFVNLDNESLALGEVVVGYTQAISKPVRLGTSIYIGQTGCSSKVLYAVTVGSRLSCRCGHLSIVWGGSQLQGSRRSVTARRLRGSSRG
jgi:serine acetyltransferase